MRLISFLFLFTFSFSSFAQSLNSKILLKSGVFVPKDEINLVGITSGDSQIIDGKYYRFMSFSVLPSTKQKDKMKELGIHFLEYIPNNTFLVSISENISKKNLDTYNVNALVSVEPKQKIHPKLQNGNCPKWAQDGDNATLEVLLYKDMNINIMATTTNSSEITEII